MPISPDTTLLCFGDSNTWGYQPLTGERYPWRERWTGLLQATLGEPYRVIEEGLNGRTTVWDEPYRTGRNGSRLLQELLASHQPVDWLILMLGTNDLKRLFNTTAWDSAQGMARLVELAKVSQGGLRGAPPVFSCSRRRPWAGCQDECGTIFRPPALPNHRPLPSITGSWPRKPAVPSWIWAA